VKTLKGVPEPVSTCQGSLSSPALDVCTVTPDSVSSRFKSLSSATAFAS
jgi:hypothetical protein